jgi:transcriptional regulator with XRE-family HTH domain
MQGGMDEATNAELAAWLKDWRKRMGLTQPQAAKRVGLSFRGYQDQEGNKRAVSRQTLIIAATAGEVGPFLVERVEAEVDGLIQEAKRKAAMKRRTA